MGGFNIIYELSDIMVGPSPRVLLVYIINMVFVMGGFRWNNYMVPLPLSSLFTVSVFFVLWFICFFFCSPTTTDCTQLRAGSEAESGE